MVGGPDRWQPFSLKGQTCEAVEGVAQTNALEIELGRGLASVKGNTGGNRGVSVAPLELESSSSKSYPTPPRY